jgi:hypothetical protein
VLYFEYPDDISPIDPMTEQPQHEPMPGWAPAVGVPLEQQIVPMVPMRWSFLKYAYKFFLTDERLISDGQKTYLELQERLLTRILPAFRSPVEHGGKRYLALEDQDAKSLQTVAASPKEYFRNGCLAAQFLPFHKTFAKPLEKLPELPSADEPMPA